MIKCVKCNTANPDEAIFCKECGSKIDEVVKNDKSENLVEKDIVKQTYAKKINRIFNRRKVG